MSEGKDRTIVAKADVLPPSMLMHPLVQQMLAKDPTPEMFEKMMALQERHDANEARKAYTRDHIALKAALPPFLRHDKVVDYQPEGKRRVHYTHTSLAGAMEVIQPLLTEFGFTLTWKSGSLPNGNVSVVAILKHRAGHEEKSDPPLTAPPDTSGNKSAAQGVASTISLLERYSALALLGMATADMNEPGDAPPASAPNPETKIDSARNMRALADIVSMGKTKEEIEKFVGRPVQQWTIADLGRLRKWIKQPAESTAPVEPAQMPEASKATEPGSDAQEPPPPPANPKEGDQWNEVVQVVECKPYPKYVTLKLRHADSKITEHNSNKPEVAELAKKVAGKEEIVTVAFSVKTGADKKKLYINVEAMQIVDTSDIPF